MDELKYFIHGSKLIVKMYTGRYPLFLKQQILALKYWIRLISSY